MFRPNNLETRLARLKGEGGGGGGAYGGAVFVKCMIISLRGV